HVTILADRGFCDQELLSFVRDVGFHYVIRIRENTLITDQKGRSRKAAQWLTSTGRARMIREPSITKRGTPIGAFICAHDKSMAAPWLLATDLTDKPSRKIIKLYGTRFRIEETFRDHKDPRFGLGMGNHRISRTDRRDRLMLIGTLAHAMLTLLGAAGESIGYDRLLKTNTSKKRTMSLFRQGLFWYDAIPNMDAKKRRPLMKAFDKMVREHDVISEVFGVL